MATVISKRDFKANFLELKDFDESKGEVAFYYSNFNSKDLGGDIVKPGAFRKSVVENKANIYHNRNHYEAIGVPQSFGEDSKGAYCVSQLALKTSDGNDAYEQYKAGIMKGHSMEYVAMQHTYSKKEDARVITECKLWGVTSITTIPMNLNTPTISVKGMFDLLLEMKKINEFLHTANISDQCGEEFVIEYKKLENLVSPLVKQYAAGTSTADSRKPVFSSLLAGSLKSLTT